MPSKSFHPLPRRRRDWRDSIDRHDSAFTYRYGRPTHQVTIVTLYTEGCSRFVISATAPIVTGRSDRSPTGFAPGWKTVPLHCAREATLRHQECNAFRWYNLRTRRSHST
jgi:hypothetical protein